MQSFSFRPRDPRMAPRALQVSSLAMLVASSVSIAGAQEQPAAASSDAPAEAETMKVVVTGSRIRGVAPVGSSLIQIGVEDVKQSGAVTTADLLKEIPQVTSMGFNGEGSLGAAAPQNITRSTAPNLRGIGPQATLTLLDGQRVPAAGPMGNVVDPSFLPPLTLQRIEVIADGASAVYGSDAVAGVINLIPASVSRAWRPWRAWARPTAITMRRSVASPARHGVAVPPSSRSTTRRTVRY
jgi:iron complex outermembrane receptor protein